MIKIYENKIRLFIHMFFLLNGISGGVTYCTDFAETTNEVNQRVIICNKTNFSFILKEEARFDKIESRGVREFLLKKNTNHTLRFQEMPRDFSQRVSDEACLCLWFNDTDVRALCVGSFEGCVIVDAKRKDSLIILELTHPFKELYWIRDNFIPFFYSRAVSMCVGAVVAPPIVSMIVKNTSVPIFIAEVVAGAVVGVFVGASIEMGKKYLPDWLLIINKRMGSIQVTVSN